MSKNYVPKVLVLTNAQKDEQFFIQKTVDRVKASPGQVCKVPLLKPGKMPFTKFQNLLRLKAGIVCEIQSDGIMLAIPKKDKPTPKGWDSIWG
jgi:hypothetical protein